MTDLLSAALQWHEHGYAPLPVSPNGRKTPAVNWQAFITEPPTLQEVTHYFTRMDTDGIGLLCGGASGELEMLEVEGRAAHLADTLGDLLIDNGLGKLWKTINGGYVERSPSGGLHWLYRVNGTARGNTKLARDADGNVTIETRGEGGFTVIAPSGGRTHASGVGWSVITGSVDTVPTITAAERDELHALATQLDRTPHVSEPALDRHATVPRVSNETRPGDDYNQRATWHDILTPHGWTPGTAFASGGMRWTRPGKEARDGISATTGTSSDGADRLYVFSSSTTFDTERPYSKFSAYAHLEHGDDYAAAARQLAREGYGTPLEEARPLRLVGKPVVPDHELPWCAGCPDHEACLQGGCHLNGGPVTPSPQPAPAATTATLSAVEPATYSLTDDGNALRLVDAHRHEVRYCHELRTWLVWNGHRWLRDSGAVAEWARAIARGLPHDEKSTEAHRKASLSGRGLREMVAIARTDAAINVAPGDLDARAYELNTPAGVVDLHSATMRAPNPAAMHTRSTAVAPDFDTVPYGWLRFLADTFAGDPALTTYVQRLVGLSVIGETLEAILPFLWGKGANGKSTLANVLRGVLGGGETGYALSAPAELLLATSYRAHPTEIARLSGARLVLATELEEGERFAEAKIKLLTGKDALVARFMGKDYFTFRPTHTFILMANDQPTVRAGGPAFWRRLRLLPFMHVVPEAERITTLDDDLIAKEGGAILAWIIRGAADYLADGLAEPASVRAATQEYEAEQDHLARFMDECCTVGDPNALHMQVPVAKVRAVYETFCRVEGETPLTPRGLTMQLRNRFGIKSGRTSHARFYAGMTMTHTSLVNTDDESTL